MSRAWMDAKGVRERMGTSREVEVCREGGTGSCQQQQARQGAECGSCSSASRLAATTSGLRVEDGWGKCHV